MKVIRVEDLVKERSELVDSFESRKICHNWNEQECEENREILNVVLDIIDEEIDTIKSQSLER